MESEAAPAAILGLGAPARSGEAARNPPSLRVNMGWALGGNAAAAAAQWALLVLLARLANPEALGRFALATAVTTPIFLFTSLQLRSALATDAGRLFRFADYLGVHVLGAAAGLLASGAVLAVAGYERETALAVLALALAKAVDAVSDLHYGLMQQHERMRPIAVSLAARGVLGVAALAAALWTGGGVALAVLAVGACSLAVLVGYDARVAAALLGASRQRRAPRFAPRVLRAIVRTSLPMGFVILAVSLRTYIPRLFVEDRFGAAELGIFAALSSFVAAGTLVIGAVGQSATPRLARHFQRGEVASFRRLLARLLLLACGVGAAGVGVAALAGRPIVQLVFGGEYAARADVLVGLMGAAFFAYVASLVGYGLTAARLFLVQLPLFTATSLACAGLSWWLVPAHGLLGAAAAWGASLAAELVAGGLVLEVALRRRAGGGAP